MFFARVGALRAGSGGEPHLVVLEVAAGDVGDDGDVGVLGEPAGELTQRAVGGIDAARGEERGELHQVAAHRRRQLRCPSRQLGPLPMGHVAGDPRLDDRFDGGHDVTSWRAISSAVSTSISSDGPPVLAGEPVVGEMEIDAGRLDRAVPGLGLHRLQRHARLAQPGQAGVAQLMAGAALQPGPSAGAGDDLIEPFERERPAASWPLQHDEDPVGVDPVGRSSRR